MCECVSVSTLKPAQSARMDLLSRIDENVISHAQPVQKQKFRQVSTLGWREREDCRGFGNAAAARKEERNRFGGLHPSFDAAPLIALCVQHWERYRRGARPSSPHSFGARHTTGYRTVLVNLYSTPYSLLDSDPDEKLGKRPRAWWPDQLKQR